MLSKIPDEVNPVRSPDESSGKRLWRFTSNGAKRYQHDIFLAICFILVAVISFNIGKINSLQKVPLKIGDGANIYKAMGTQEPQQNNLGTAGQTNSQIAPAARDLRVVVSKKSTSKKYHFLWCPSVSKIKEENKVWFNTEQDAINAGYTLAGNCTK